MFLFADSQCQGHSVSSLQMAMDKVDPNTNLNLKFLPGSYTLIKMLIITLERQLLNR